MAKISPRPEITSHPLYQATMAAQHMAYQLMREVPPDRKADATELVRSTVHATTYVTFALDPEQPDRAAQYEGLDAAAKEALEQLVPLASFSQEAEGLRKKLEDMRTTVAEEKATALSGTG